jgi:hypothetical protein
MKRLGIITVALMAAVSLASANVVTITDTTAGGATVDGTVNGGEYIGFGTGINSGFGNVWGAGAELHVDSDSAGNIYFGFRRGPGGFNDVAVIYIDSIVGGFADTTTVEDDADGGRAAISGDGAGADANQSEITFGASFRPDYAIAWESGFAGLFEIRAGGAGSNLFVQSLGGANVGTNWEGSILASNIGLTPGGSFNYVVTYLNSGNAFRSDEVMGQTALGGGNVGQNPVTLADEYNTFVTIPEPSTLILGAVGAIGLLVARRRKT